MILVMIKGDFLGESQTWNVSDEKDARYQVQRRVEKEGWECDRAFLVEDSQALPVKKWIAEYYNKVADYQAREDEERERQQYEKLKTKFERKSIESIAKDEK